MCTRHYLRSVGIQASIVNVQAKGNGAIKSEILGGCADLGVGEEEGHCLPGIVKPSLA